MMLSGKRAGPAPARRAAAPAEVGMGHFAAIGGMTEEEFSGRLWSIVTGGDILDVLGIPAQAQVMEWASERGLEHGDREFLLVLRLSLNRVADAALYCACRVDLSGPLAIIRCEEAIPGVVGAPPRRCEGLERLELSFRDMEASLR